MSNPDAIPDFRYGHEFGMGTILYLDDPALRLLESWEEKALVTAWSHGCPIPHELIKPEVYGAEKATKRYLEVNFWFNWYYQFAKNVNPNLAADFKAATLREISKSPTIKRFDWDLVPSSFSTQMSGLLRPQNYAWPRVYIEMLGRDVGRDSNKIRAVAEVTEELIRDRRVSRADVFLARLSQRAVTFFNVPPEKILPHYLSEPLLYEEGCLDAFQKIAYSLRAVTPSLFQSYLNPDIRAKSLDECPVIEPRTLGLISL